MKCTYKSVNYHFPSINLLFCLLKVVTRSFLRYNMRKTKFSCLYFYFHLLFSCEMWKSFYLSKPLKRIQMEQSERGRIRPYTLWWGVTTRHFFVFRVHERKKVGANGERKSQHHVKRVAFQTDRSFFPFLTFIENPILSLDQNLVFAQRCYTRQHKANSNKNKTSENIRKKHSTTQRPD